jgi:cell growth-regulating nucleolar protein
MSQLYNLAIQGLITFKSCISEAQKYQGALYRPEKEKKNKNNSKAVVPHKAYVEDANADYGHNSHITIVDPPLPAAPSPPSAAPGFTMQQEDVNVFDFLVDSETPNASRLELGAPEPMNMIEDTPQENTDRDLVRVRFNEHAKESVSDLIEYGSGPIPTAAYQTPAPKVEKERKKEKKDRDQSRDEKKDKKRKRLHVDTRDLSPKEGDEVMTDAPPVLHSGLTGGLNRLLSRPSVFPPSPDYSGGDVGDASPGSPLKKTKHSKRGRVDTISNNIMSMISTRTSSREHSEDRPRRKHRRHRDRSERPSQKMLEYKPVDGEVISEDSQNQMVVFQPRAELLLSFINKGPESERGLSMNKALKRYHRERHASGIGLSRAEEEKELWRNLRMKKNERGEIVLFLG